MTAIQPRARMQVPLVDLKAQYQAIKNEVPAAVAGWIVADEAARAALPVLVEIQRSGAAAKDDKEKALAQEAEAVARALKGN